MSQTLSPSSAHCYGLARVAVLLERQGVLTSRDVAGIGAA